MAWGDKRGPLTGFKMTQLMPSKRVVAPAFRAAGAAEGG